VDLSVQVEELTGADDRWSVARVAGELDVATSPRLRELLVTALTEGRRHLVLDLTGVQFLDSTGLGVIVGLLKRARTLGGDLRIVCPNGSVRRVFEITALDRTMPLSDTVDAALAGAEG
jgi:anti-sigma B factor antagonist